MHIGYIGLGKMGSNMVERLSERGYAISAYDPIEDARQKVSAINNVVVFSDVSKMIDSLPKDKKIIWLMIPSNKVSMALDQILPLLSVGDTIIDGGNTFYKNTLAHSKKFDMTGVEFIDVGVSGGPAGARSGACMMIGGKLSKFEELENLFIALCVIDGYAHVGPTGSGHFVKMIHNGIEYGMMQSIGEGFNLLKQANEDPGLQFNFDLEKIAKVYNHGSVITSSLIEWTHQVFKVEGQHLDNISGEISHSGEGEWTVDYAESQDQPVPIIKGALEFRVQSIGNPSFIGKVVSALRNQFGGHSVHNKHD